MKTVAGHVTISRQLLDQAPLGIDKWISLHLTIGVYTSDEHTPTQSYRRHGRCWARCSCGWRAEPTATKWDSLVQARDHLVAQWPAG